MSIPGIRFSNLCGPAYTYLVLTTIAWLVMLIHTTNHNNILCFGVFDCDVPQTFSSNAFAFSMKAVCIAFWTWILNIMCSKGLTTLAWFLALAPFVAFGLIVLWRLI